MGIPRDATPMLSDTETDRQREQSRRALYWDGDWLRSLEDDAMSVLGTQRREAMGVLDQSCNLGPQICRELSTCYLQPPQVTRAGSSPRLTAADGPVSRALLWSLMPDFQGRVLWLQDYVMRLDITSEGGLLYRPVPPHLVEAIPDPAHPDQPIYYREWVWRTLSDGPQWTQDVIDLRGEEPSMTALSESGARDLTAEIFGGPMAGPDYPYRWGSGKPWIPVEVYHRDPSCALWSWRRGRELFSATRIAAVLWSFYVHLLRTCTWRQKAILGGRAKMGVPGGEHGARYMALDPTSILVVDSPEGSAAVPQLGSWDENDPRVVLAAIEGYMAQAAHSEGVSPAELQRISGEATSGYAMSLTNEGKRAAQRRFGPQFQIRDQSLIAKSAALLNRTSDAGYPEDGYVVSYVSVPRSPEEERALREQIDWEIGRGYISEAEGLVRLRPELSISDATTIIARNRSTIKPPEAKQDA